MANRILRAAQGGKANITGFSMRAFKEAASKPRYDPWERALVLPCRTDTPIVTPRRNTRVAN